MSSFTLEQARYAIQLLQPSYSLTHLKADSVDDLFAQLLAAYQTPEINAESIEDDLYQFEAISQLFDELTRPHHYVYNENILKFRQALSHYLQKHSNLVSKTEIEAHIINKLNVIETLKILKQATPIRTEGKAADEIRSELEDKTGKIERIKRKLTSYKNSVSNYFCYNQYYSNLSDTLPGLTNKDIYHLKLMDYLRVGAGYGAIAGSIVGIILGGIFLGPIVHQHLATIIASNSPIPPIFFVMLFVTLGVIIFCLTETLLAVAAVALAGAAVGAGIGALIGLAVGSYQLSKEPADNETFVVEEQEKSDTSPSFLTSIGNKFFSFFSAAKPYPSSEKREGATKERDMHTVPRAT